MYSQSSSRFSRKIAASGRKLKSLSFPESEKSQGAGITDRPNLLKMASARGICEAEVIRNTASADTSRSVDDTKRASSNVVRLDVSMRISLAGIPMEISHSREMTLAQLPHFFFGRGCFSWWVEKRIEN